MNLERVAEGVTVRVRFPQAEAVYLLGEFNRWATTALPMVAAAKGGWEAFLPSEAKLEELCFFVFDRGERFGRIIRRDLEPK